jgi:hypothetical protein
LASLACPSATECIAGDAAGFLFVGTGPPVDQTAPSISGDAIEGRTLTEHHGTWTYAPLSYSYQWEDCDLHGAACTAIPHATGQTYVLAARDAGHTVRVSETASNAAGAGAPADSVNTAAVLETTTVTVGNRRLTLTSPSQLVCVARTAQLALELTSTTLGRGVNVTLVRAAFYLDRGITRGHGRHATHTPNATARRLPVTLALSLARLKPGGHTLKLVLTYRKTIRRHGRKQTVSVVKTVTVRFSVC